MIRLPTCYRRIVIFFCVVFSLCGTLFAYDPATLERIEKDRVVLTSFDRNGQVLRSVLGFIWQEGLIVCSFNAVKNASVVRVALEGRQTYSDRIISYSDFFDLAVMKTEQEVAQTAEIASSDTVGVGDTVYYFERESGHWRLKQGLVKGWFDSGKGYEVIRVQPFPAGTEEKSPRKTFEASPLYNASGKIVGWMQREFSALPVKAIAELLNQKTSSISLTELSQSDQVWGLRKTKPTAAPGDTLQCCEMKTVQGNKQFPFALKIPRLWAHESFSQSNRFLLRATDPAFGITLEMRIMLQPTDDLTLGVERAEVLFFSGLPRSNLNPYSADDLTGFIAFYDDTNASDGYSTTVFYTMSQRNFYILSVNYPRKYQEEMKAIIQQIVSSLHVSP